MPQINPDQAGGANVCALLDTIAYTEGTDDGKHATNDRGYDVLVGHHLFTDYSRHPDVLVKLSATLSSTAAGRYQVLFRYWTIYQKLLGLPDFSPISQDLYAINQFRERGALVLIQAGRFEEAIGRINNIWASLPGAPYAQRTVSIAEAKAIYTSHGGISI